MNTMKAARLHQIGATFQIDDVPIPQPGKGDVRVRVEACGLIPNLRNVDPFPASPGARSLRAAVSCVHCVPVPVEVTAGGAQQRLVLGDDDPMREIIYISGTLG